ncbi:MAG TPA: pyridoxal-dependent decarboxylase [Longimicrobiales bacterium]|nr:pyridoxal-dependent decarboxylase [Longimicrobiales bacterium]
MTPTDPSATTPSGADLSEAAFRAAAARAVDIVARYLADPAVWPVLAAGPPGHLRAALPERAPERGEPMEALLDDFERLILPHTTHWNHPGFMAYFGITGSGPGVIAELLIAALNVNAMVWRSGPAQTELEEVTLTWLRRLLGLDDDAWDGSINDTASISTMHALAAAREAVPGLEARTRGLAGRPEVPRLRVYCSEEAHSSVDKAAITLGFGLEGVRRIATDDRLALDPSALERAIAEDRSAGMLPVAVVATVGTTSTTALDPVSAIADLCAREGIWLHVDAAYGGAAALLPEMRRVLDGCERADSIVVNPHKWLFVPIDCSVLYTRRPDLLRRAFSLVPAYLETPGTGDARNLMDYGLALGRRFRALKLWFVLRWFGAEGIRERLREHIRLALLLADRIDEDRLWQRLAPVEFSVVVFRRSSPGLDDASLDALNAAIIERVNRSGEVFLAQTRVRGRLAIRVAIGNLRTTERHVMRAWELLQEAADGRQ